MLLSEIKSNMGIKVAAQLNEREEKKEHKFEFYNPNAQSVKVRFYFVQDESQLEK